LVDPNVNYGDKITIDMMNTMIDVISGGKGNIKKDISLNIIDSVLKSDDNDDLIVKYIGQNNIFHESKEFQAELDKIFEKEITKILEGTDKFTGDDMKEFVDKVVKESVKNMRYHTGTHLENIYKTGQQYVSEITRKAISFSKIDTMAIKAIQESDVLFDAYEGMSKVLSEKLNKIIEDSYAEPETFSLNNMIDKMRGEANTETYRLERIVRTETQSAAMKGREIGFVKYDPEERKRFDWAVRDDSRTSKVCKIIKERVEAEGNNQGVSLSHIKRIIKEESMNYNGPKWKYRDFVPHINCRSGLVVHI